MQPLPDVLARLRPRMAVYVHGLSGESAALPAAFKAQRLIAIAAPQFRETLAERWAEIVRPL